MVFCPVSYLWLKFITRLFLKLRYNIFILVSYFFLITNCAWSSALRVSFSTPSDMEWPVNVTNIPKNVTSIYWLYIFCVITLYRLLLDPVVSYVCSRNVLQARCNHIFNEIHMFQPHQTLIFHCIVWNVNHWKLHILILTIRIWFHFYYHDPFHN